MAETDLIVNFTGKDKGLSSMATGIGRTFSTVGNTIKAGLAIGVTAVAGISAATVGLGAKLVGLGSDAEEMQGKFNVVFAQTGTQVAESLSKFASEVGRSRFELQGMASTFGDTLKPMGFTEQAAADFSVKLSKLAVDLGSFNDMETDEALRRLQGTLIGSHENALAFGVIINENTLKAELAAQGWDELTGAALEQAKVQARINLLMAGTTDAQGDAARTAGSWANVMRGLKAILTDTATEMGGKLLPVLTPILQRIKDLAVQWLPVLVSKFEGLLPVVVNFVTTGFNRISEWLKTNGPIIREFVTNALDRIRAWVSENGPRILSLVRDNFQPLIEKIVELGGNIKDFLIAQFQKITAWVQENKPLIERFWEVLSKAILFIRLEVIEFGNVVLPVFDKVIDVILGLGKFIMQVATGDWAGAWESIKSVAANAWEAVKTLFRGLADWVTGWFGTTWENVLNSWRGIWDNLLAIPKLIIQKIIDATGELGRALLDMVLPDWMMPGSPSPWELSLTRTRALLADMANKEVPALSTSLQGLSSVSSTRNDNRQTNITQNITTQRVSVPGLNRVNLAFSSGGI